ncbi:MAG TPA: two-component system response regulator [Verrucomicrobia bacterium]|nr:two-component system response regulator [Verrucomicrobiota bacterium]
MRGKYILLAEDNPNDAELTVSALADAHMADPIVVVPDGAEALDFLYRRGKYVERNKEDPTVILLDLKMPKVDGMEVLRSIKQDPLLRRIPVVMLTSSREEADLVRSYESGVNAYVVKPLSFEEFINAVREIGLFWGFLNEPAPPSPRSPGAGPA